MRVGLVLGGGGVVGIAYHAASLAAIEHDLGWDPRSADVIVGTSAGALVGALLRRGVPASDLAGVTVGAAARSSPPGFADALRDRPDLPALRLGSFLGRPRRAEPPSARAVGPSALAVRPCRGTGQRGSGRIAGPGRPRDRHRSAAWRRLAREGSVDLHRTSARPPPSRHRPGSVGPAAGGRACLMRGSGILPSGPHRQSDPHRRWCPVAHQCRCPPPARP